MYEEMMNEIEIILSNVRIYDEYKTRISNLRCKNILYYIKNYGLCEWISVDGSIITYSGLTNKGNLFLLNGGIY